MTVRDSNYFYHQDFTNYVSYLCRAISLSLANYLLFSADTGGLILKYVPFLTPTKLLMNLHRGTVLIQMATKTLNIETKTRVLKH